MAILRGVAVAGAVLALSMTAVAACDDFAEEMAVVAAVDAAKQARAQTEQAQGQQAASAEAAAPAPTASEPTSLAAAEPKPAPTQTSESPTGTLRR